MSRQKIVIKVGTSSLTQGKAKLSRKFMCELTRQIAYLHEKNVDVILVTSAAIAAGKEVLKNFKFDKSLPTKQMFASIGQVQLMQTWTELFSLYDIYVGQMLLTRRDLSDRKNYLNARDTLFCLLSHRAIPIINENDSIATKEIRVGDNDNLAALVANLMGADLLILLTDQEGLFTKDPSIDKGAKLIETVEKIDADIFKLASGSKSSLGTGGMVTKLEAALIATQVGTETVVASAMKENVLIDLFEGKKIGTRFKAKISPVESRKRWLLSEKHCGKIIVDSGAKEKILQHGASLLPSGMTGCEGGFDRGSIVHISDAAGTPIAVGITNYGQEDIEKIIGLHSSEIEKKLGYSYGKEVIHRSNMTRI